jgi:hypothetical protein
MIKYAAANSIRKCTTSSIMETQETFYRVLSKEGWKRKGCNMVFFLDNNFKPKVEI